MSISRVSDPATRQSHITDGEIARQACRQTPDRGPRPDEVRDRNPNISGHISA
jgi:hypothetical protein